jgi:ferredoxin
VLSLRRVVQLAAFATLAVVALWPGAGALGRWLFRGDSLAVGGAVLATRDFYSLLLIAALPLLLTLFFGRLFCGWLCPLGAVIDAADAVFSTRVRRPAARTTKTHLLLWLALPILGGASLLWALAPMTWAARLTAALDPPAGGGAFAALGAVGLVVVALALGRRGFCRALCPLGALLGLAGRFAPFRLRTSDACTHCGDCVRRCRMAAFDGAPEEHDRGECILCRECDAKCPAGALRFRWFNLDPAPQPNLWRRSFLLSAVGGLALSAAPRAPRVRRADAAPLRPPGAAPEEDFRRLCERCGSCVRVCPTNGLRPDDGQGGPLSWQSPILSGRDGGCAFDCNACSRVCPTFAIRPLMLPDKQRLKIGLAVIDPRRCKPLAAGKPCLSCYVACPVGAITLTPAAAKTPWGEPVEVPAVNRELCTGCGLCEAMCPVAGAGAIRTISLTAAQRATVA